MHKRHHLYGDLLDRGNLANIGHHRLLAGFTRILTATAPFLRPGGHVVITVRPWREHAELIDLPAQIAACGRAAGLVPVERCVALLGRVTEQGGFVARGSFFQRDFIRSQRAPRPPAAPDRPRGRARPGPTATFPGVARHHRHGHHDGRHDRSSRAGPTRRAVHSPDRACGCPTRHGSEPVTAAPATRRGRSLEHGRLLVCDATVETMADDHVGDPATEIPVDETAPTVPTAPVARRRCCPCTHRPRPPACWRCRSPGCGGR